MTTRDRQGLFLGGVLDAAGERSSEDLYYDTDDLTTHGVIVGMTGSGKTGLGVILLEELLLGGVPALVIDPKGDMGNLLLNFPDFRPADFRPWIEESQAREKGITADELSAKTADRWRSGLASWGLATEDLAALRAAAQLSIYTPGSTSGIPMNVLGSLAAPKADWHAEAEVLRDEIEGLVSGLLGLIGIHDDPLASREHILLSNLIEHAWRLGKDLDMARLLAQVQQPPLRKLGVFDVDTFFPPRDRMALAMRLNALIAAPSFAAWLEGQALDVQSLLWTAEGRPRAAVVYLAHLSEDERQFLVTLLLSKVVSWMRAQSGTSNVRAAIYMDEVFGFAPPTAAPPTKKPILTLLKQARAFGVSLLLSTQNPVDLDYKAMSNAGTWMVGRLQTERDKLRILEALQSASGQTDVAALDRRISGLGKRQFLLRSAGSAQPTLFTTRWAMSYLRGPLTRDQVATLMRHRRAERAVAQTRAEQPETAGERAPEAPAPAPGRDAASPATLADNESRVAPEVAQDVPVYVLDPAAPWADQVGAEVAGRRYQAALAARVQLRFDDRTAELDHTEEWEAVYFPLEAELDPSQAHVVDHDARDFLRATPDDAVYVLPKAPVHSTRYFNRVRSTLKGWLYRNRSVEIHRNRELKLYSRVGEDMRFFLARCDRAAREEADAETAKLRDRVDTKLTSLRRNLATAERQLAEAEAGLRASRSEEMVTGAGSILDIFLGGRGSSRSLATRAARRARGFSSRHARSSRAESRVERAMERIDDIEREIDELEAEFLDDVRGIDREWTDRAAAVETVEIGLEKNDIDVTTVALVWIPTS